MNYRIFIVIIVISISACKQSRPEKTDVEQLDNKEAVKEVTKPTPEVEKKVEKDSDTTTYDYATKLVIKMNSKDSIEAFEDKIFYETNINKPTFFEVKNAYDFNTKIDPKNRKFTIKYKQRINGYKVRAITEFDSSFKEKFKSILEFSDTKGSSKYFLVDDFFDWKSYDLIKSLNEVKFSKDTTIYLDYTQIEKGKFLGYETPFYFQDVNLDGELELVFNGLVQYCRNNHSLFVYSFSQNKFLKDPPFDRMSSQAEYDFNNNTITWYSSSACNYFGKYTYKFYRTIEDNTKFKFYLQELLVCSGNVSSTYTYNRKGEIINVVREKVVI